MTLIRWAPFEEMDRIFSQLGGGNANFRVGFDLAADVYEEDNNVVAEMHIPGIDPKKLNIEIDGEFLKISGSREDKKEEKRKNYFSREIKYGSFERVIALPKKVISDETKAVYLDGTLKIEMPVEQISKVKKITVH